MRAPEVVFLDIDDTLYDYERSITDHVDAVRRSSAVFARYDGPAFLKLYWEGYARVPDAEKLALLRSDVRGYRHRVWREALAPAGFDEATVDAATARFSRLRDEALVPNDGALDFLRRARDRVRLGVISNGPGLLQRAKLRALGVEPLVRPDLVFISHEVGCDKPDPAIFRRAVATAGVDGSACLMVGDDPVRDAGSKAVGMGFALFAARPKPPAADAPRPDIVVRSFAELGDWMRFP